MTGESSLREFFKKTDWIRIAWVTIITTLLIASVYIIFKGPDLGNDSYSYIHMYVFRPPGYPLFLAFLRLFTDHSLWLAVILQTFFNAAVFIFFIRYICKEFGIHPVLSLLILPFIVYYFVSMVEPQKILTESIAFPLFLLLSVYFIKGVIHKNIKGLIIALGINVILVLIRGQFLFVFPLVVLAGCYVIIWNRTYQNAKSIALFFAVVVISYGSVGLINRTYHYIVHDTFSDTQSYLSFVRNAFYISEKDDYLLFEDEFQQELHREMYDTLYSSGLNADAFYDTINPAIPKQDRRRSDLVIHFHESLKTIAQILLGDLIRDKYQDLNQFEYELERDELLKEFSGTLIKENFSLYMYLVASEIVVYGFNGNRTFMLTTALIFIISFIGLWRANKFSEILFFFIIARVLNLLVMALSNRVLGRYTMYEEFILLSVLMVMFIKFMIIATNKEEFRLTSE